MDEKLKAGQKGQSDEELDATLDKALMLFRYIQVLCPFMAPPLLPHCLFALQTLLLKEEAAPSLLRALLVALRGRSSW